MSGHFNFPQPGYNMGNATPIPQQYYHNQANQEPFYPTIDLTESHQSASQLAETEAQLSSSIMMIDELIHTYSVDETTTNQVSPAAAPKLKVKRTKRYHTSCSQSQASSSTSQAQQHFNFTTPLPPPHTFPQRKYRKLEIPTAPQSWTPPPENLPDKPDCFNDLTSNVLPSAIKTAQSHLNLLQQCNVAALCQIGQETVMEIVQRSQTLSQNLISAKLDETAKGNIQTQMRAVKLLFRRLHTICSKCCEDGKPDDLASTDDALFQNMLKYAGDIHSEYESKLCSEEYRLVCEERAKLQEQAFLKNGQMKEIIERLRRCIWEVNTMLAVKTETNP